MYHLAQRYRRGKEVPQDISLAVEWLLRSADLGHAHAQSSMGVRYYYGEGVPKKPSPGDEVVSRRRGEEGARGAL
jgi:TPR repeat protein